MFAFPGTFANQQPIAGEKRKTAPYLAAVSPHKTSIISENTGKT